MSQQPPYGEPSGQNPQPPPYPSYPGGQSYPGYQGPAYGGAPNPYPPNKSNTTRNVLIIVAVLVVLVCGGAVAGIVALVGSAKDSIENEFNSDYRGSSDRPITVDVGKAFSIRGFDYAEGWTIGNDDIDPSSDTVTGLSTTNNRDDGKTERINLVFKFVKGSTILAQVTCFTDADVGDGQTAALDCNHSGKIPSGYDAIEVNDSALYE